MARKDFNRGMEAGAKPFEGKFNKMSNDFHNAANGINSRIDDLNKTTDFIIDELNSIEKKRLYDLNIVADIGELGDDEKELLMAILYTLAEMSEEVSQYQQDYLRSIKAYLQVKSVQNNVDLAVIENIENINDQKAILQTIMEYLFIENANHHYLEEYEDVIDYFSVNKKGIKEIQECINTIYKATGLKGLAEMYGYEPEVMIEESQKKSEQNEFYGYAGEDISEACADIVNTNNDHISVGKYIVFAKDNNYSRIEKASGELKTFEINYEFDNLKLSPAGDEFFFGYDSSRYDSKKPLLFNVETFEYKQIEILGEPTGKVVSNSEKMFYSTSINDEEEIVEYDIKTNKNKLLEKIKNKEESYGSEQYMVIAGNKLYLNVTTDEFSAENQTEEIIAEYDCQTGEFRKLCCVDNHYSFMNQYGMYGSSVGVYKNYLYSIEDESYEEQIYLKYIDLKNLSSIHTEKIPQSNVKLLTVYGEWIYYVELSWEDNIYKYNMFTGENICLVENADIVTSITEGLFKKTTTYSIGGVFVNVIGSWFYYSKLSFPVEPIKKVNINSGSKTSLSI